MTDYLGVDMSKGTCSIDGCASEVHIKKLCRNHYSQARWRKHHPIVDRQIKLEARFWAKVSKADACWEWTASKLKGHGRYNGVYAHRFSYELAKGPIPEGLQIDHMCHNRGCVNPDHLRAVTSKQNNENRLGANPNSKSGVRGVHWRNDCEKWQVTIHAGPKMHHVGYFTDLEAARQAAIDKRNELFTHNDTDRKAA